VYIRFASLTMHTDLFPVPRVTNLQIAPPVRPAHWSNTEERKTKRCFSLVLFLLRRYELASLMQTFKGSFSRYFIR